MTLKRLTETGLIDYDTEIIIRKGEGLTHSRVATGIRMIFSHTMFTK